MSREIRNYSGGGGNRRAKYRDADDDRPDAVAANAPDEQAVKARPRFFLRAPGFGLGRQRRSLGDLRMHIARRGTVTKSGG